MTTKAQTEAKFRCPNCGADKSDSSPSAPCPACLMQLGLESWQSQNGFESTQFHHDDRETPSPEQIAAHFPQLEILNFIGCGGMGSVYCARQKSLDRLVALKIIQPSAKDRKGFADRFAREAKALAQLSHPNIVTVHDFGQIDGMNYLMMEYVDGINLRQLLREGKLDPQTALQIVPPICDALQYAHDSGIVHRDIKPENILLDAKGNVKIADFGLAKLLNKSTAGPSLTRTNHVMGTMHYMAPEQFERPTDVDHRADIYSLGVVFYELLTGELPLGRFAPPSQKVAIDVRLDEIVLHTLEKEPDLRYQQISNVKTDVQSMAANMANKVFRRTRQREEWPDTAPQPPVKPAGFDAVAAAPTAASAPRTIPPGGFWQVLTQPQTYKNMLYHLVSFPLGIIYFVVLVTLFSVGISTLIVWIGIPVLLGTFLVVKIFMWIESVVSGRLLAAEVPVTYQPSVRPQRFVDRAKNLMLSQQTWKGVLYLFTKFPLGILSFVLLVTLFSVPFSLICLPVIVHLPLNDVSIGSWRIDSTSEAFGFCIIGLFLMFVSAHILNGLAWINAKWAQLCLAGKTDRR